jgi:hypothetical protein
VFLKWSRHPNAHGDGAEGWLYRTAVRGALDELRRQLVAIEDITKDGARFVFKDGTERRQSVVSANRVLYVVNQNGDETRIDLAQIASVEFLGAARSEP